MTEMRAYAWKPKASFSIDAQIAGEELDRIRGHNSGDLSPEAVIAAAANKKNPLHSVFEWDDKKAGHEYRLQQAGLLIRSVIVTISGEAAAKSEPMQVTVKRETSGGGSAKAHVITPEELHTKKVERGWRELEEWQSTYGSLPEFGGVAAALTGFLALQGKQKKRDKAA